MLLHKLRKRRSRTLRTLDPAHFLPPPPPPPATVVHVQVVDLGGNLFSWSFDRTFDPSGSAGWVAADFAGFTINSASPGAIDSVDPTGESLILSYGIRGATTYRVEAVPTVLRFSTGPAILDPATGPVGQ